MHDQEYPRQRDLIDDIVFEKDILTVFPNRIVVCGSRTYNDYPEFAVKMDEYLKQFQGEILIHTGMASRGADALVVRYCEERNIRYRPFPANWDLGRGAGMIRNREMAVTATAIIAFYDGKSSGTRDMISVGKKRGLPIEVVEVKPTERIIELYFGKVRDTPYLRASGFKVVDVTPEDGVKAFIPNISAVAMMYEGSMGEDAFKANYSDKMYNCQNQHPEFWDFIAKFDKVVFVEHAEELRLGHSEHLCDIVVRYLSRKGHIVRKMGEAVV